MQKKLQRERENVKFYYDGGSNVNVEENISSEEDDDMSRSEANIMENTNITTAVQHKPNY